MIEFVVRRCAGTEFVKRKNKLNYHFTNFSLSKVLC